MAAKSFSFLKLPIFKTLWKFACSLKLALTVMVSLTLSLIVATVLESETDMQTAQYYVYQASWFSILLIGLGINIFSVAMSRWPWKKNHFPFLLAHAGILILLYGSWLTQKFGVDGQIQVAEGQTASEVELNDLLLVVAEGAAAKVFPIRWIPPSVDFSPVDLKIQGLKISRFLTHAEPKVLFLASEDKKSERSPALHVKIIGGPKAPPMMRAGQDYWLWTGEPSTQTIQAGGAVLTVVRDQLNQTRSEKNRAFGAFEVRQNGEVGYSLQSKIGETRSGTAHSGQVLRTPWLQDVSLEVLEVIPHARADVSYEPSRIQYGSQAPSSALQIEKPDGETLWLGLGERAFLEMADRKLMLGFFSKKLGLPFSLKLERFEIERDPGSLSPSAFRSQVSIVDDRHSSTSNVEISMNEPLQWKGYTVYQASYVDGSPRPTTSVFSVNQDPGRKFKYSGSLFIVLGSIWLFAKKIRQQRKVTV